MPTAVYPVAPGVPTYSGTFNPTIFSGKMIEAFWPTSVIPAISSSDWEGEIKAAGDKVTIRAHPDVEIFDYVKGQGLTQQVVQPKSVDLTVDQGHYFNIPLTSVDKAQSDLNLSDLFFQNGSESMKKRVDTNVLGTIYAASGIISGANAGAKYGSINLGTTASPISLTKDTIIDKITEFGQVLDEAEAPEQGRWLVVPAWFTQRLKASDLRDASMTGDGKSILRNGRIGMIDRFEIYRSEQLYTVPGSYTAIMGGHKASLAFAAQITESEQIKNPSDFGDLIRSLMVYGFKAVKPEAMLRCYAWYA